MKNVRIWFYKLGAAKYASHLDLARMMGRILKISRLPVWYTEGYNPRIYMTFAMPLALGISGERECLDIRLEEEVPFETIKESLNSRLPPDIRVIEAAEPKLDFTQIGFAEYELRIETGETDLLVAKLEDMLSSEHIFVTKKSKRGDISLDLKPYLASLKPKALKDSVSLELLLPCSTNGAVNPVLAVTAFEESSGEQLEYTLSRKKLLCEDMTEFR